LADMYGKMADMYGKRLTRIWLAATLRPGKGHR
jgi:hypothetical protein